MNRIETLFQSKQKNILNVYCTAGYPLLESTVPVMQALQDNGADMVEIGMPYSDPLADGPVIQHSNMIALEILCGSITCPSAVCITILLLPCKTPGVPN